MKLGGHFDIPSKQSEIKSLEDKLNDSDIWNNHELASNINSNLSSLKKIVENYTVLHNEINSNLELVKLIEEQDELYEEIVVSYNKICEKIKELELNTYLNKEFDNNNCFLEIHPGAGGTEACDWADMLLRMYKMFFEKNGFNYETIDEQKGETAGIKSVLLKISAPYAYGYLKSEIGVHRLVRISPFDANKRRHTSFASVEVSPVINDTTKIEVRPDEIKVDTYRAGGAGGQHINKTESAVRITHIPTGIIVACQNERSQTQNRETAMKMLYAKLAEKAEKEKEEEHLKQLGLQRKIEWGSQIRSYVLCPYNMVKDHRTNYETGDTAGVLDGNIKEFIIEKLKFDKQN